MDKQPLVSIITVVYNGETYIDSCLKSVANQSYKNIEHIIIDGGSTDSTISIVKNFPHVSKVVSEPDTGIYNAMNKGLKQASGEIIGILNCDDFYYPNTIDKVVTVFESEDCDIVYGDMNEVIELSDRCLMKKVRSNIDMINQSMSIFHPTMFVKKSVYGKLGGFDEQYEIAADYEFVLRALKGNSKFFNSKQILTGFRVHGKSFGNCISIKEGVQIMEHYQTGFSNQFKKRIPRCVFRNFVRALLEIIVPGKLLLGWKEQRILKNWEG